LNDKGDVSVQELLQAYSLNCPYCWENISITLDLSAEDQDFVEDCSVCCAPIAFRLRLEDGVARVEAERAS
jgi:hypothetical protein